MHIDISTHIDKLLFLHDTVIIPGFGAFTATKSPATVDYGGGTIAPPSKTLTFNENLSVDDGILAHDVAQSYGLSTEEARKMIEEFVDKTQALLNQREIVSIPSIGRLYKNYVQKIQFLPDTTNYNSASYGLPPLQFSPISTRSREHTENNGNGAKASTAPAPPPPATVSEAPRRSSSGFAGVLIALLLLLGAVAGGIWWYQQKKAAAANTELSEAAPQESALPGPGDTNPAPARETAAEAEKPAPATEEEPRKPAPATPAREKTTPPPTGPKSGIDSSDSNGLRKRRDRYAQASIFYRRCDGSKVYSHRSAAGQPKFLSRKLQVIAGRDSLRFC